MTTVKSVYGKSENYQLFRSWVALQQISIGSVNERVWKYYDFGPKEATPLVCIPGASGTADVFYRQMVRLSSFSFQFSSFSLIFLISLHFSTFPFSNFPHFPTFSAISFHFLSLPFSYVVFLVLMELAVFYCKMVHSFSTSILILFYSTFPLFSSISSPPLTPTPSTLPFLQ